jgi:hypothetical protein
VAEPVVVNVPDLMAVAVADPNFPTDPRYAGIKPQGWLNGKPLWCAIIESPFGGECGYADGGDTALFGYRGKIHSSKIFTIFTGQRLVNKVEKGKGQAVDKGIGME